MNETKPIDFDSHSRASEKKEKWITWEEFRMAGMLTVVNDALAPHGFAVSAHVITDDNDTVLEDRSEFVVGVSPLRTIDGSPAERPG